VSAASPGPVHIREDQDIRHPQWDLHFTLSLNLTGGILSIVTRRMDDERVHRVPSHRPGDPCPERLA